MAKNERERDPRAQQAEAPTPLPPIATAREAARVEFEGAKYKYALLTVAAQVEEQEAVANARVEAAEKKVAEAEGKRDYAIAACDKQVEAAEAAVKVRIDKADADAKAIEQERDRYVADAKAEIQRTQAEIIQIERDRDAAKTRMIEELAGLKAALELHRSERDSLVARLTA